MAAGEVPPSVRVELLGPLRLTVGGQSVDVRGPKRRAVLALLALAEGRVVTVDHLVDALWPGDVVESGRQSLHSHVSRLRGRLGPAAGRLETRADGYRMDLGSEGIDAAQVRALLATARGTVLRDPKAALAQLRRAQEMWRGPVLADLTDVQPIAAAVEGLAQLHREVIDALVGAAIAAGQAGEVEGIAAATAAADPLREPATLQQMRVLAATGRAPEALQVGRDFRHRLTEETGLDPSPALSELEREIAGGAVGGAPLPRPPIPASAVTRLIGRDADIAAMQRLLGAERLVTLVGPGGVGKTRVALEVARREGAASTLLLAPVTDPAAVPHALAAALDLAVVQGDVLLACAALLGSRPALIVVDNCEHLLEAVRSTVDVLLTWCPGLVVLATSREPLGLAAEYVVRLAPLPLPAIDSARSGTDTPSDLLRVPSVAVFLERAGRVRHGPPLSADDLQTVADIVRRLDGMPLAIELAAGRLSTFSLSDLHQRLDRSLDLLGGQPSGAPRHRTLRATVEWSYRLLSEEERRLFRHLSVFVDGVALDDAERIAAELAVDSDPGSALARLVDASMVEASFEGGTRYRMLETLRAYGQDQLVATGELAEAADRFLRWAVELVRWIGEALATEQEPSADAMLRRELANLRAAWRLARSGGYLDTAAAMVVGLFEAITYRDLVELRSWAEELASDPAMPAHPRATAVFGVAAEATYHRGDHQRAEQLARTGLGLARDETDSWMCRLPLSVAELARGAFPQVVEHALGARTFPDGSRENYGIAALAAAYGGDPERARELNARGVAGARSFSMRSWAAYVTGEIETAAGRRDRAEAHYLQAIELARTAGATFLVGVASVGLLAALAESGRTADALRGYREVIDYFARTGNWTHLWVALRNLADLLRSIGDEESATLLNAAADAAPNAPATARPTATGSDLASAETAAPDRTEALRCARSAIKRHLAGAEQLGQPSGQPRLTPARRSPRR